MSHRLLWRWGAPRGDGRHGSRPVPTLHLGGLSVFPAASQFRQAHQRAPVSKSRLLNPPASTRPPPLNIPSSNSVDSTLRYWFRMGKGYLNFYKDGLRGILASHKFLREKIKRTPSDDRPSIFRPYYVPRSFSRADWVLLWRVRHDMLRLPLFGLMLLVIGEFTALVVIYVDRVVPYTCRFPRQVLTAVQRAEQRRRVAFDALDALSPHGVLSPRITHQLARIHVLRSLDLAGTIWDRLGFMPPGMWEVKGRLRMAFLEGDDRNLLEDGGPLDLEPTELVIACRQRGIDTLGKSEAELRNLLSDWLRLTAAEDINERRRRMATLLLTRYAKFEFSPWRSREPRLTGCRRVRPEHWPTNRDFAVPEWEL